MRILIIGASGLVGGSILNYFANTTDWDIKGTFNNFKVDNFIHFNASDESSWNTEIITTKWDVIIHTGALTHVDKCEEEQELSKFLTVQSTMNLVALATKNDAKFVYISTDYVFDGANGPYDEDAATNPLSIYGQHKLDAEKYIQAHLDDYLIMRITNVYGDELRGKNLISRIIQQISESKNLHIIAPSDQFATPINANDIARALLLLIIDNRKGIYHLSSTDYFSRVQFINRVNVFFGNKLDIQPILTKDMKQLANRPLYGGLISKRFLSEYPTFHFTNIDDYLNNYNGKF